MLVKIWGARGSIPTPLQSQAIREKIISAFLKVSRVEDISLREKLVAAILGLPLPGDDPEKRSSPIVQRQIIETYLDNLSPLAGSTASGNTPCISVEAGDDLFIIDAGSGIRELGIELMQGPWGKGKGVIHLIFSHPHWDHIQGFPFFRPAFIAGNKIIIYSVHDMEPILRQQQNFTNFPVSIDYMQADFEFRQLDAEEVLGFGNLRIRNIRNDHPGDAYSYRFEKGNKVFVYASDSSYPHEADLHPYINFFKNADVLIFDTQFTQRESDEKEDWGHSSSFMGVEMAQAANVKTLLLYHYDPTYSDVALEKILVDTLKFQENQYPNEKPMEILIAQDGQEFDLTPPKMTDLHHRSGDDIAILSPRGIFNEHVATDLNMQVEGLPGDDFPSQLIIDMSAVEMLQVAGLRALVKLRKKYAGSSIVLAAPSINVQQLIELAGYLDFFAIHPSVEEALEALQAYKRTNLPGQTIKNRYYLEEKVGDGRLGTVYRAVDLQQKKTIAIKILSPSFSDGAIEHFLRHARQVIELDHPHIANIMHCDKDQGLPFMVEEFVEGLTLDYLLIEKQGKPLKLDVALSIAERMASALEYAHTHGVIHGDLKPKNVLMDGKTLKISDFGLGRLETGKSLLNIHVPLALVTASYLAPEQVLGHPIDERTDIYAFGIIMYELLTGVLPFEGTDQQILEQHLSVPPRPLREHVPDISPMLEHFILKLLNKDPNKRYKSIRKIRHILAGIVPVRKTIAQTTVYRRMPPSPMVSREKPLIYLTNLWATCQQGQSQITFVTGESGAGKTRLLQEFAQQIASDVFLLTGSFGIRRQMMPYQPFLEAIQSHLNQTYGETTIVPDEKPHHLFQQIVQNLPPVYGRNVISLEANTDPKRLKIAPSPIIEFPRLAEALKQVAQKQPCLLIFDDVHWADANSLYLLDYLIASCRDLPLMIVVSYAHSHLKSDTHLNYLLKRHASEHTLSLARLNQQAVGQILNHYWSTQFPTDLTRLLARLSQGNPLYIKQLIHILLDEENIVWEDQKWVFKHISLHDLPDTIQETIPRRIAYLPKEVQTLLTQAAVLGNSFQFATLFEMSYLPEQQVLDCLDVLLGRQLIKIDAAQNLLYFDHPEIRQVVYDGLSDSKRGRLHQEAAETLEHLYLSEQRYIAPRLVYHFQEAGNLEKLLTYSQQAAEQMVVFQANDMALTWYQTALTALAELAPEDMLTQRFELLLAQEQVYKNLGWFDSEAILLAELTDLVDSIHAENPAQQARVYQRQAAYYRLTKQLSLAQTAADMALVKTKATDDAVLQGESLVQLAYIAIGQGNLSVAEQHLSSAHNLLPQADDSYHQARVLNGLGIVHQHQANYSEAEEYYQQALTVSHTNYFWINQAATLNNLGSLHLKTGHPNKAKTYAVHALEINRLIGNRRGVALCEETLATIEQVLKGES
ncbi:protein kinase [Anaerolineales bacterium HSG25]|nr:protein kinase [Anaerolineales bacterium HSG25]